MDLNLENPEPNSDVINNHNDRVLDLCYETLNSFAQCMMSQKSLMIAYIEVRKDATRRMTREAGYSVSMLFNTIMMITARSPVPLAQMSASQAVNSGLSYLGLAAAPTTAVFPPFAVVVSAMAAVYGVYRLCKTKQEEKELEVKIYQLRNGMDKPLPCSRPSSITKDSGF